MNEPALLLADEPTSDLDEVTESQIVELFRGLNRQRNLTLLMVTHNLRLAERTDRVIHISDGRLAACMTAMISRRWWGSCPARKRTS